MRAIVGALLLGASVAAGAITVHPVAIGFDRLHDGARRLDVVAELHCLALNLYHEARSQPDAGRAAVAAVTLNRVRSPRFPNSICGVVWQRGQFSWTHDGKPDRPYNRTAWQEALRMARIAYHSQGPSPVGNAVYYHAAYVTPTWARTARRVARVGIHIFYEAPGS